MKCIWNPTPILHSFMQAWLLLVFRQPWIGPIPSLLFWPVRFNSLRPDKILKFFQTGIAPITPEETIELFAFMEAADESKRQGGKPVKISDVMAKAMQ